jgi:hypothetical protein
MAYAIKYSMEVIWVWDGAGPMTPGSGAQKKKFAQSSTVPVAGGDTLTQANLNNAMGATAGNTVAGSMLADLETQTAAALAAMTAWATGGN